MQHKLISGDNHIDLTYCPADLWSADVPAKWKQNAPRVEERNDGQHWFVDDKDRGMWNGVGPGFLPYTKGSFGHVDEMKDAGFVWDSYPGAAPRPTTPELRIADLDRDGLDKEIIYGCLMINDLISDAGLRIWANARYNDCAADLRRCARMGLKGGDLAFKRMGLPLYHRDWYALWEAAAECRFPISFHSTGFKALRAPDSPEMEKEYAVQYRLVRSALFQLDTMEVLVSLLASGACEKYPDFNFRSEER